MSKYTPLQNFLQQKGFENIPVSFEEIETLLGFDLPPSSRKYRAWWSNNASNSVMTQAWLDAGYETAEVDMTAGRLTFKKVRRSAMSPVKAPVTVRPAEEKGPRRHPLFGALKGTLVIADGVDLTEPADPEWAAQLDRL